MKPPEYWAKRSEAVILQAERKGAELTKALTGFYSQADAQIRKDVEAFFGRYATKEGISPEEAHRRLTVPELKRFSEELRRYYTEAEKLGLSSSYNTQLRTLSARAYVSRQMELLAQVRHQVEVVFGKTLPAMSGTLADVYKESYYREIFYMQQGLGFGTDFARIDTKTVKAILSRPWLRENFSSRIWHNKESLLHQLEQIIPRAFATGENSRVLGDQLAKRLNVSKSAGERLVRTEVNHAANQATMASYRQTGVAEYEYLATLDNRTSEICASLDGKVFRVADASVGVNYPPMHPHCRSTTVPYFPPDEFDGPSSRAARDADGKYYTVPAALTYAEWKKAFVNGNPKEALSFKMQANRFPDKELHARYRALLGKDIPKGLKEFQTLKYSEGSAWGCAKLDYRRRSRLQHNPALSLPGAAGASAADEKFTGYLFNAQNPQGYAKGVAFASRLGYTGDNWQELRHEILQRAPLYPAKLKHADQYGAKYEQQLVLYGTLGKPANVVVGWRVHDGKAWMTTAYIKEAKGGE